MTAGRALTGLRTASSNPGTTQGFSNSWSTSYNPPLIGPSPTPPPSRQPVDALGNASHQIWSGLKTFDPYNSFINRARANETANQPSAGANPLAVNPIPRIPSNGQPPPTSGGGQFSLDEIRGLIRDLTPATAQHVPPPAPSPTVPPPTAPSTIAPPVAAPVDQQMAFAKAKDSSSRIANAALRALRTNMTERGLTGSGIQAQNESDIMSSLAGVQSQALYNAAEKDADRQWDAAKTGYTGAIGQRANDMGLTATGYQGGISQRGQDNSLATTGYTGGITQRGQDMDAGQQLLARLQGFLPYLRTPVY
jgi:hypothetical protein